MKAHVTQEKVGILHSPLVVTLIPQQVFSRSCPFEGRHLLINNMWLHKRFFACNGGAIFPQIVASPTQ